MVTSPKTTIIFTGCITWLLKLAIKLITSTGYNWLLHMDLHM